jgi:hypothetical protein
MKQPEETGKNRSFPVPRFGFRFGREKRVDGLIEAGLDRDHNAADDDTKRCPVTGYTGMTCYLCRYYNGECKHERKNDMNTRSRREEDRPLRGH